MVVGIEVDRADCSNEVVRALSLVKDQRTSILSLIAWFESCPLISTSVRSTSDCTVHHCTVHHRLLFQTLHRHRCWDGWSGGGPGEGEFSSGRRIVAAGSEYILHGVDAPPGLAELRPGGVPGSAACGTARRSPH